MDKIWEKHELGHAFESRAPTFDFQTRKYFKILFKFLEFLRSLDQFKVLITEKLSGLLLVGFIWLGVKVSLKYIHVEGGTFVLPLSCPYGVKIAYFQTG